MKNFLLFTACLCLTLFACESNEILELNEEMLIENETELDQSVDLRSSGDHDGDGIANRIDNCPFTVNIWQLDADGDGIGNVCDPLVSNATTAYSEILDSEEFVYWSGGLRYRIKFSVVKLRRMENYSVDDFITYECYVSHRRFPTTGLVLTGLAPELVQLTTDRIRIVSSGAAKYRNPFRPNYWSGTVTTESLSDEIGCANCPSTNINGFEVFRISNNKTDLSFILKCEFELVGLDGEIYSWESNKINLDD